MNLPLESVEYSLNIIKEVDLVAIITDHTCVDYKMLKGNAKLIVDTRGVIFDTN